MKPIHRSAIFSIFFAMGTPLMAQSTWNGTTNANWSVATNWSPGIPANGDDVIIADVTTNGLTLDDGSHTIGSLTIGTTGTRISAFTLQTPAASTLTLTEGIIANGNFTTTIGARLRGNYLFSGDQTVQVLGAAGSHSVDAGIAFNETTSGVLPTPGVSGSVTLNGNVNKTGTGQLTFGATTVSGAGDLNINDGSVKFNAGGSQPLTVSGPGKIAVNNSGALIFAKNTGTFNITRPIQFNNTARLETGGNTTTTATFDIASDMEWNGIHTVTNNNSGVTLNFQFPGVMSGSGSITKNGAAQMTLLGTSANTLSGQVTLAAGTLRLDKTGVLAVPGNILVTGGTLNIVQSNQIGSASTVTLTGGTIAASTGGRTQTLAALNLSTTVVAPSVSGLTVTGATAITNATTAELNSGQTFTTNSFSLSNNSNFRIVGNNGVGTFSTVNVGPGGLTLNGSRIQYGNNGNAGTQLFNLGGDVASTGASRLTVTNTSGPRILDLQGASRSFVINDGSLDIQPTVQNGTLVKSGAGTLILSRAGSTANFSFTDGPVQITTQADAGNVTLSGGSLLMDVGGVTPTKLTTSGNFTSTGGTIELTANNGSITPGTLELIRYNGTLTGTPTINIPPQLAASRMNPVVNYGTGTNSAITITSTAVPLSLTWHGATAGGLWDTNNTANFNGGTEKFYALDSVTFDDSGVNGTILLNSAVFPTDVIFSHGTTRPTYTVTGTGSISGPTKITKSGLGTTILATNNNYTGATDILADGGTLQVGNNGLTGSLGTGAVSVGFGSTLRFARTGTSLVGNVITGTGTISNTGSGTTAFTADSPGFLGEVSITGGILQLGDGGANGSLGTAAVNTATGTTFAVKRTGAPTIGNLIGGTGAVTISGGNPNLSNFNTFTGGVSVIDGGVLGVPADYTLGEVPVSLIPNAIRLNFGGLKNQDSDTTIDPNRGITITGEAYFTAGWTKPLNISGPITGTGDIFINYDATPGIVRFSDATSTWNGVLTLGAAKPGFSGAGLGVLEINTITNGGVAGPLGTASADPANLVFNGGRLTYTGDTASTNRGFTLAGGASLNVTSGATTLTMSGMATGPGALTKVGDGILVLSGSNNFVGNVVADDGVLGVANTNALGDTAKTVIVAGDANGGRIPELQFSGGISPTVAEIQTSGAGVGSATGVLRNISGNNTLTVTNQITLRTGVAGSTFYSDAGTLTINTPLVIANATNRFLTLAGPGNGVINGVIANGTTVALPVTKNGSGTWTLNGAHTYTGATTVNEGVLSLGQAALNDAAAVTIATGATLNLNFTGEDRVGSLSVDGQPPLADGLYSAATHPLFITGSGSIRVGAGGSGYASWASGFPFNVGVNDGPTQDADFDSITNLFEYMLGGIPVGAGAGNTSILPTQTLTATDLILTFRRSDLSETDVTLKVQWSANMISWTDFATIGAGDALPAVDVTEDSPTADRDTVVVTIPRSLAPGGKIFARLQAVR